MVVGHSLSNFGVIWIKVEKLFYRFCPHHLLPYHLQREERSNCRGRDLFPFGNVPHLCKPGLGFLATGKVFMQEVKPVWLLNPLGAGGVLLRKKMGSIESKTSCL